MRAQGREDDEKLGDGELPLLGDPPFPTVQTSNNGGGSLMGSYFMLKKSPKQLAGA